MDNIIELHQATLRHQLEKFNYNAQPSSDPPPSPFPQEATQQTNWNEYNHNRQNLILLDVPLSPRPEEFSLEMRTNKWFPSQNGFSKDKERVRN